MLADVRTTKRTFTCSECGQQTTRRASSHAHFCCTARCRLQAFRLQAKQQNETLQTSHLQASVSGHRKRSIISKHSEQPESSPTVTWIGPWPGYLSNLRSGLDLDRKLNARMVG